VFKVIQLFVILYSLTQISSASKGSTFDDGTAETADQLCAEALYGETFMRLVLTDAMVFVAGQYIMIYAVNHGLPLVWKWYQVTNHFTKPLRTSYTSSEDAKIARSLEAKRKRKLCCCRQGYRLQKRSVSVRPQSLAELWHRRGTWWVHSTQSQWWMLIKEIKPESDSDSSSDEEELVAVDDDDDDDDDADSPKSKHGRGRSILGDLAKRKHDVEERLEAEQAEPALEGEEYADESEVHILDWGSGKEMQVLTKLPKSHLRVFSQLLADAGLDTRNKIIDSNKSPEELRRMIEKQTGKHRCAWLPSTSSVLLASSHDMSCALQIQVRQSYRCQSCRQSA
jgi:hypothetical protein